MKKPLTHASKAACYRPGFFSAGMRRLHPQTTEPYKQTNHPAIHGDDSVTEQFCSNTVWKLQSNNNNNYCCITNMKTSL